MQGIKARVVVGQFGFGQRRMDLRMADLVQQNSLAPLPAAELRDEMVAALRHAGRDRAAAKAADRILLHAICRHAAVQPGSAMRQDMPSSGGQSTVASLPFIQIQRPNEPS